MKVQAKESFRILLENGREAVFVKDKEYNAALVENRKFFIADENKCGIYLAVNDTKESFLIKEEIHCEYFEPDDYGDICHAGKEDECLNHSECTAKYDVHGALLVPE